MKNTVHIISHSHWDREWYLPFEKHRGKLLKLMDACMEEFAKEDSHLKFHLDGQTIVLEDYLEIYPEKKRNLEKYIQKNKFQAGPWYVLQDEFLTSGEANVRNLLYGMADAQAYGAVCKIGYFPDTFGNVGQMPQILCQAGMEAAVFGRGVRSVGFNNKIDGEEYTSAFSELMWQSPDGSQILGILFANWYNNGSEIPVEEEEAKKYWDEKLKAARAYTGTEHLLFMNGSDHQPLQKNLEAAMETAKKLYPDIEFVQSDFPYYVKCVRQSLRSALSVVRGELTSQETDGYNTLVNTASSRNYLKSANRAGEVLLEKKTEPVAVMAMQEGMEYPYERLKYCWKTLMQNHPHDSICGCSIDAVHREMEVRFEKSRACAEQLLEEAETYISRRVDSAVFEKYGEEAVPFVVFNTSGWGKKEEISVMLELCRSSREDLKEAYVEAENYVPGDWKLLDSNGDEIPCLAEDAGVRFSYELPENTFRKRWMARTVKVKFQAELLGMSYKTYALVRGKAKKQSVSGMITGENCMENEWLSVWISEDGSFCVTDKKTGKKFRDQAVFEDTGDVGNEYIFRESMPAGRILSKSAKADIRVKENSPWKAAFEVKLTMRIPACAAEELEKEQAMGTDARTRKIGRGKQFADMGICMILALEKGKKSLDLQISLDNTARDHRLRILFPTDLFVETHRVDSVFETVKRPNRHGEFWKNPSACEHQQYFVAMADDDAGVMIANRGQYEYEILKERNTIAVTLLRAVGEMGDWGYFPTPDAQCPGAANVHLRWIPQTLTEMEKDGFGEASGFQNQFTFRQIPLQAGVLPAEKVYFSWKGDGLILTGYKAAESGEGVIARFVNQCSQETELKFRHSGRCCKSNVIEKDSEEIFTDGDGWCRILVKPCEIVTVRLLNR